MTWRSSVKVCHLLHLLHFPLLLMFEKLSWLTSEMNIFIYVVIIINIYIFTTNILSQSSYLYLYISKVFNYILVKVFTFVNTDD